MVSIHQFDRPKFGQKADIEHSERVYYQSVTYQGEEFKIGDCAYIDPEAYSYKVKPAPVKKQKNERRDVSSYCSYGNTEL